jgi:hypothetical protein
MGNPVRSKGPEKVQLFFLYIINTFPILDIMDLFYNKKEYKLKKKKAYGE